MTAPQDNDRRERFRVKAATPPPEGERAKPRVKAGDAKSPAPAKKAAAKKAAAKK